MIPDSEYNFGALVIIFGGLGSIFLMMLCSAVKEMRYERRRRSYYRHPSQRNRATVQK